MPTARTGRRTSSHRTVASALCLSAVVLVGAACSAEPPAPAARAVKVTQAPEPVPTPEAVATTVGLGKVYGRVPRTQRARLKSEVGALVDAWWEAAYLDGDYPRGSFRKPFKGFTPGAQAKARRDKLLTTNRDVSEAITGVTPRRRALTLDVLAVDGTPRTVTARFKLRFDTDGARARKVTVRGRLFLTRRTGSWRIFGYDIAKWSKA